MKVKSSKKASGKGAKLLKIQKSDSDIGKSKDKLQKIKKQKQKFGSGPGPGLQPVVTAGKTALTFAEKKALAVKKKNQSNKLEVKKTTKPNVVPQKQNSGKPQKRSQNTEVVSEGSQKPEKVKKQQISTDTEPSEDAVLPKILISTKTIKSALKACKKALKDGFDQKKNLFGEDLKFGLQIAAVKIPDIPSRNCRMQLPNAIYRKGDDICLIVKDLTRGRKQDTEKTLHHWEDKLRELGIDYITQVIPFQQLKQDYREYEMKLKLVHRFDRFLVDARINGHVFNFLGNGFIRRCKNPTPVILDKDEKIVKNLNKALGRVTYKQTNTGRLTEIQFCTDKMPLEQSIENAEALVQNLKTQYPGGWLNIRTIYLKPMTDIQLTFPLYVSKIDPNSVPVPKMAGPRETFEKRKSEKLLEITKNKYKFEGGNLVRVPFEQRRVMKFTKGDEIMIEDREGEEKDEEAEDEEMALAAAQASDTEGSDPDDDGDDN